MRVTSKLDASGLFVGDVLLGEGAPLPPRCIENRPPEGFHAPRWTGSEWEEGKPEAEILKVLKAQKVEEMKAAGVEDLSTHIPHGRDELSAVHNAALVAILDALNLPVDERLRRVDEAQRKAFAKRGEVEAATTPEEVEGIAWT